MFKKIYDAVLYNGEIEMFAIRTHVLKPYVDGFYVIDSPDSINGAPKLARQLKDQLADETILAQYPWLHEIECTIFEPRLTAQGSWPRQHEIRDVGFREFIRHVFFLEASAIDCGRYTYGEIGILWSDIDEIPDTQFLRLLKNQNVAKELAAVFQLVYGLSEFSRESTILAVPQLMCYWKAQFTDNCVWHGTRIFTLSCAVHNIYKSHSGEFFRNAGVHRVPESNTFLGWHYSYMGDKTRIREKLKAFSHAELSSDWHVDHAVEQLEKGLDPFDREGMQWKLERGKYTERGEGLWVFDRFPFIPPYLSSELKQFLKYMED